MTYAQPVIIETPEPCVNINYASTPVDWGEKKEKRICTDDLYNWGVDDGYEKCCYTIVYYEAVLHGEQTTQFLSNITAIIYEGEDCKLRTKGEIIHKFHEWLYKSKPYGFFSYETHPYGIIINGSSTMDMYITSGGCFQKNGNGDIEYTNGIPNSCNSSVYCCRYSKQIDIENGVVQSVDSLLPGNLNPQILVYDNTPNQISCPSSCKHTCDNVMMEEAIFLCNPPCNTGFWSAEKTKKIEIPGCPSCTVTVAFRTRTTSPCPEFESESFNDIYLDRIEFYDSYMDPCYHCQMPDQYIHSTVMDHLINNEFSQSPGPNECDEYYRVIQSACWHEHYQDGDPSIDLPPKRILLKCGDDNCCVHRYKLCRNIEGDLLPPELLSSTSTSQGCHFYPYPCIFVCEPSE
ncbi:MAG: hypothetical protein KIT33_13945 [Candidatus Kapabacteria bacterium]|nr:hypothetical protein [Ignavibacteriota bacterium]MCW5886068.1 hypothetical protein [Candidatus Kapabacteria bacterium]